MSTARRESSVRVCKAVAEDFADAATRFPPTGKGLLGFSVRRICLITVLS